MKPKYEPGKNDIYTFLDCRRQIKGDVCLEGAVILNPFYPVKVTGSCSENRERGNCPRGYRD